ncbi:MAG: hypothetical protein ABL958_17285 [Bdellovibrionia bacterium]
MRILAAIFIAFLACELRAGEFDAPTLSSLEMAGGYGSGETWTAALNADLGLRSGYRLGLGVSGTWAKTEDGPLSINSNRVSFGTDPLALVSGLLEYERWGQSSVIQADTLRLELQAGFDFLTVVVAPEVRSIGWFSRFGGTDQRRFYSTSEGWTARIGLMPTRTTSFTLGGGAFTYKDVPADFTQLEVVGFISSSSLNLGSGFLESQFTADVHQDISRAIGAGAGFFTGKSFIDKMAFSVVTISGDWNVNEDWSCVVRGGQSSSEGSSPSHQLELSARHLWF